jgi:hypothetical protein
MPGIRAATAYRPTGPCTGNVNMTANFNHFSLGACAWASDECAAIFVDAQGGNKLTAYL